MSEMKQGTSARLESDFIGQCIFFSSSSSHSIVGHVGKTFSTGTRHMITLCLRRPGNVASYNSRVFKDAGPAFTGSQENLGNVVTSM